MTASEFGQESKSWIFEGKNDFVKAKGVK